MASNPKSLLDPSAQPFPLYYFVAAIVSVLAVVAVAAAFGVAEQLPANAPGDSDAPWWRLEAVLDPFLLLLLGIVLALCALALWIVTRYERRLQVFSESRARNRAIVDNMLNGAIHIDSAGRVAGLNAAAERIFGYSDAELKGQPISLLFASPLRERLEARMLDDPDLGLPPSLVGEHQMEARLRDGTTLPLSLAVSEVHVGGYLVYTAIVREIDAETPPAVAPGMDLLGT